MTPELLRIASERIMASAARPAMTIFPWIPIEDTQATRRKRTVWLRNGTRVVLPPGSQYGDVLAWMLR